MLICHLNHQVRASPRTGNFIYDLKLAITNKQKEAKLKPLKPSLIQTCAH